MDFSLIKKIAGEKRSTSVQWRRALHQHPETGLELPFTRKFVTSELDRMGLEGRYRQLDAGIIVELVGKEDESLPSVALRVDMDALPLCEKTHLPFASSHEGYMHACGHDAHTAIGLGVVGILQELQAGWGGRVRVIFQAGEEELEGARRMVEQGALENPVVDVIIGLHVDPQVPVGSVGLKPGQINAFVDEFVLTISGRSAHGASPHFSEDPVLAASFVIQALQTIVSRNVPPLEAAVVSIGRIEGGTVFNIIPDRVVLEGTVRSLHPEVRDMIISRMRSILKGVEQSFGVGAELCFTVSLPPVICDGDLTERCRAILCGILDEKNVVTFTSPQMGGDDFAFYAGEVPASLIRLGCGKGSLTVPLHSSRFSVDEDVLVFGVELFSYLLINLLNQEVKGGA